MTPTRNQIITGAVGLVVNGPHLGEWVDWPPPYREVIVMKPLPMRPYAEMPNVAGEARVVHYRVFYLDVGPEKLRLWGEIVFQPDLIDILTTFADGVEFKKRFERDINFRMEAMKWPVSRD